MRCKRAWLSPRLGACVFLLGMLSCSSPWAPEQEMPCDSCEWVVRGERFVLDEAKVRGSELFGLHRMTGTMWRLDLTTGEAERFADELFFSDFLALDDENLWLASSYEGRPLLRFEQVQAEPSSLFPFEEGASISRMRQGPGGKIYVSTLEGGTSSLMRLDKEGEVVEVLDTLLKRPLVLLDANEEALLWRRDEQLVYLLADDDPVVLSFEDEPIWSARLAGRGVVISSSTHARVWDRTTGESKVVEAMGGLELIVGTPCGYLGLNEEKNEFFLFDMSGAHVDSGMLPTIYAGEMPSDPLMIEDYVYFVGLGWVLRRPLGCERTIE